MESGMIILLNLLCIPIILACIVGLYYLCVAGILRTLRKIRIELLNYKIDKIRIKEEKNKIIEQEEANRSKDGRRKIKFSNKKKRIDNYVCKALITASIAAALFIASSIVLSKCFDLYISFDNIVLTFVGILATFVVVTNYAQVMDIKKDLHTRIDAINMQKRRLGNRITLTDKYDKAQIHDSRKAGGTNAKAKSISKNVKS